MNVAKCILKLQPNAKFLCWENDYNRIEWHKDNTAAMPALAELDAVWPAVQADEAAEAATKQQAIQDRIDAALSDMAAEIAAAENAVANWNSLSATQKDAALKRTIQALVVVFKVIRFVLHRLT